MGITLGSLAGRLHVPDDFDAPLSEDELRAVEHMLPPPTTTEDMLEQLGGAGDRLTNDGAERLKVTRRLV